MTVALMKIATRRTLPTSPLSTYRTCMARTEAERRLAHAQALANTVIEGHEPTPEFLADCEAVNRGTITLDELRLRSLLRAKAQHPANDNPVANTQAKADCAA